MRKVFVSYARVNRSDVDQLVGHLGVLGCQTWVDSSLHGGQEWWDAILQQIADCDVFLAIISRDALNSVACRREFDWAEALGKPVLPVAVEPPPTALPRRFSMRQIVDYSNPGQRAEAALILAGGLATLPPAPPLPEHLPESPAAPLSYLTDLVDLVSEPNPLDHENQRQILLRLEPALRSVDPNERRGGSDILELFSSRDDLYADVDRMITFLKSSTASEADPKAVVAPDASITTPETHAKSVVPQDAATAAPESEQVTATELRPETGGPAQIQTATKAVPAATETTPEAKSTNQDDQALEKEGVDSDAAGTGAPGADADTRDATEVTPIAGSAGVRAVDESAPGFKPFAQSDEHPKEVDTGQSLLQRLSLRTKIAISSGAVALVAIVGAAIAIPAIAGHESSQPSPPPQPSSQSIPRSSLSQVVLPFTGLSDPSGVAVDGAGAVYVADLGRNRVFKLAAGAGASTELPFTHNDGTLGVAVDGAGAVYVADGNGLQKLAAGAGAPTTLSVTGLDSPGAIATDAAGTIYLIAVVPGDWHQRLLKLAAGAGAPTELPFTGLASPPGGVAVDTAGAVYVADSVNNRVLKLAAGAGAPTELPFTGLRNPYGVAVDNTGNIYVTDSGNHRVLKLAAGAGAPTELPFTGLRNPYGVAVDNTGNIYVTDSGNHQVLKLPPQ